MEAQKQFRQWEGRIFGAGYGSGEFPIMKAVKTFFDCLENERSYDYEKLEKPFFCRFYTGRLKSWSFFFDEN